MEYIKEEDINDITNLQKNVQLIKTIINTQNDLKKAHMNFEFAVDELIDFYAYQIKALQSKHDYLTKLAKSKNIDFDVFSGRAV